MKTLNKLAALAIAASTFAFARSADASLVNVTINGVVEYNELVTGALQPVKAGQAATLSFNVDSNVFTNSVSFPDRGYNIIQSSYQLSFPTVSVGMGSTFPAGQTPYFDLRNNDPKVDGFLISGYDDNTGSVPLNANGSNGQLTSGFEVTYSGNTLSSLNILDAIGTYNYTGLSVFDWPVDDGGFDALYIDFSSLTISAVPEPTAAVLMAVVIPALCTRRRKRQAASACL